MPPIDDVLALARGLAAGDPQCCQQFWAEYGPRMERLAAKRLPEALRRRVGPEDVAQSACRTFFRRAQEGQFTFAEADDLWRLLCAITLAKVRKEARFHFRQKRGLNREAGMQQDADASADAAWDPEGGLPSPDEEAAFADQLDRLTGSLDEEERQLVQMRLEGYTQEEIASRLGCAERTVRRILKRVQSRFQEMLDSA